MKDSWYVVPAGLAHKEAAGGAEPELDENELEARLIVLPPVAPRLPRRLRSKKKEG